MVIVGQERGEIKWHILETEDDELAFAKYELLPNDNIAMMLGGSGDYFAYALSNRGQEIGAQVYRIPPFMFAKELGEHRDKDYDARNLALLLRDKPELFYQTVKRDRDIIWLRVCLSARTDAMKARIACEQRLRTRFIGSIFCSPDGYYPEGSIEDEATSKTASDPILHGLIEEEEMRNWELLKACEALEVYREIFEPITGCGPAIASRIIGAVIDIRRFPNSAKFRAYCGLHVLKDGKFPRRRSGKTANWHGDCRQAFYLLGDQFNRRPDSEWGKYLRDVKENYRQKHPAAIVTNSALKNLFRHLEVYFRSHGVQVQPDHFRITKLDDLYSWFKASVLELGEQGDLPAEELAKWENQIDQVHLNGSNTKLFSPGHIHKMALWYTRGKFAEYIYREWWKLAG